MQVPLSLHTFCNNLFPSSSFCFRSKSRSYGHPWYSHYGAYSLSCNLTLPISRVLIVPHLIFYSLDFLTSTTCCNLPGKCTSVKYKARQKTGVSSVFPLLFCCSLFSQTLDHSYFFIILDSVSYLTWVITVIKNQKQFLTKNYQLVLSVK